MQLKQAFGIAAAALLVTSSARADDSLVCINDTPPAPSTFTSACADPASCPNAVKGLAGKYTAATVVYKSEPDVGACDTANAYCPNRCEDPRASCIKNRSGKERCTVALEAIIYTPKPPPRSGAAVVLVTGSTACVDYTTQPGSCALSCAPGQYPAESFCGLKTFLLKHDYIVMWMYPRGYNDTLAVSTGLYVGQRVPQEVARPEFCASFHPDDPTEACTAFNLEDEGSEDVGDAVDFLKTYPHVDPKKIAVIGHSYGGIRTLRFNQDDHGQRASVVIAPASESWCRADGTHNTTLQENLLAQVDKAEAPLFFLQPQNDVNLSSTVDLSHEAGLNRQQFEAAIYPKVKDSSGNAWTYGDWAHSCFVTDQNEVDVWAPTVRDFIGRYGVK